MKRSPDRALSPSSPPRPLRPAARPAPPPPRPRRLSSALARLLWALPLVLPLALALGLPGEAAAKDVMHTVRKGQTLGGIARRYGVPVDAILQVNGIGRGKPIKPGQVLLVPDKRRVAKLKKRAARDEKKAEEARKTRDEAPKRGKAPRDEDAAKGEAGKDAGAFKKRPKRPGLVQLVRGSESARIRILSTKGRLVAASLPKLSKILRFFPTGEKTSIDPRLATLLGMVSDHFGGRTIRVVSGFRPYAPGQATERSSHNHGRAVDFAIDGVPNTVVRDFCRTFRNAGVGFYPNSSFIHLDVRKGRAYWVDYSGPGETPQYHRPRPAEESAPPPEEAGSHREAGSPETDPTPSQDPENKEETKIGRDRPGGKAKKEGLD